MQPPTDHPGHADVRLLWQEMNNRFVSMERWLERMNDTLDALAKSDTRIAVLEARDDVREREIRSLEGKLESASRTEVKQGLQLAKLDQVKAAAIFLAGALLSLFTKKIAGAIPWLN